MSKPLSNKDILRKCEKYNLNVKFVPYHELKNVKSLFDIMPCIILYELHNNVGHWVALWVNKTDGISYFDPTGRSPDRLLINHYDNTKSRQAMNADYTYLNLLLYKTKKEITYNSDMLQPDDSMTCGYWCSVRLIYGGVPNDDFNAVFLHYTPAKREDMITKIYNTL